jgi:hypothetical protein
MPASEHPAIFDFADAAPADIATITAAAVQQI